MLSRKVLLMGWDAADWEHVMSRGVMVPRDSPTDPFANAPEFGHDR